VTAILAKADMGDEHVEQQFGEDMVLSVATSVLANSILLCKDERGAYFRWLARIVLYSATTTQEQHDETQAVLFSPLATRINSPDAGTRTAALAHFAKKGTDNPVLSQLSLRDPAGPPVELEATLSRVGSPKMARTTSITSPTHGGHIANASTSAKSLAAGLATFAISHGRRERSPDGDDHGRGHTDPTLPEPILKALRLDCGLPDHAAQSENAESSDWTRISSKDRRGSVEVIRRKMAMSMFQSVQDRFAKGGTSIAHRAKRKARVAKIVVALRSLRVTMPIFLRIRRG